MGIRARLYAAMEGNRRATMVWILALVAADPVLYLAALLPAPWLFALATMVALAAEQVAPRRAPRLFGRLSRVNLGGPTRLLVRDGALLVLLVRVGQHSAGTLRVLVIGLVVAELLGGGVAVLARALRRLRQLPMVTRNVDLSALRIPTTPPRWLTRADRELLPYLSVPIVVGVLVDTIGGVDRAGAVGVLVSLVVGVGLAVITLASLWRNRRLARVSRLRAEVLRRLRDYRPEVLLYFSLGAAANTTYQVDCWLTTLARLRHRALIVVREPEHVARIAPTAVPIACVRGGPEVMDLDLPELKVACYVGNVANNIHLLRANGIRHVFIGHGDSDKVASANPFSRVYDEVWVAGRAGRDRYRRAGGAVRDEAIVEVGRPQLAQVRRGARPDRRIFTVLYAPTWEGWSRDLALSSVPVLGEQIIRVLLAISPQLRVIYKPHPLTGYRDPRTRLAHRRVMARLVRADGDRIAEPDRAADQDRAAATARLATWDERLATLRGPRAGDDAQRARDNPGRDPAWFAELTEAERGWQRAYWASEGWWAHRVVTGARPDLYSCFDEADLLIADVSGVVSDFVATGRPYVLTNVRDEDEDEFRRAHTVAAGAYPLGTDVSGLADLVAGLRDGADPLAGAREALRHYLLGPDQPDPITRFNDALDALIAKADG